MIHKFNVHNTTPIGQNNNEFRKTRETGSNKPAFNKVLEDKLTKANLKYSKHADFRMRSFGIINNRHLQNKLQLATDKARSKNIKEGLIIENDYAYLVSVTNNTVITVVDLKNMKDNVFTNIDGAVIL